MDASTERQYIVSQHLLEFPIQILSKDEMEVIKKLNEDARKSLPENYNQILMFSIPEQIKRNIEKEPEKYLRMAYDDLSNQEVIKDINLLKTLRGIYSYAKLKLLEDNKQPEDYIYDKTFIDKAFNALVNVLNIDDNIKANLVARLYGAKPPKIWGGQGMSDVYYNIATSDEGIKRLIQKAAAGDELTPEEAEKLRIITGVSVVGGLLSDVALSKWITGATKQVFKSLNFNVNDAKEFLKTNKLTKEIEAIRSIAKNTDEIIDKIEPTIKDKKAELIDNVKKIAEEIRKKNIPTTNDLRRLSESIKQIDDDTFRNIRTKDAVGYDKIINNIADKLDEYKEKLLKIKEPNSIIEKGANTVVNALNNLDESVPKVITSLETMDNPIGYGIKKLRQTFVGLVDKRLKTIDYMAKGAANEQILLRDKVVDDIVKTAKDLSKKFNIPYEEILRDARDEVENVVVAMKTRFEKYSKDPKLAKILGNEVKFSDDYVNLYNSPDVIKRQVDDIISRGYLVRIPKYRLTKKMKDDKTLIDNINANIEYIKEQNKNLIQKTIMSSEYVKELRKVSEKMEDAFDDIIFKEAVLDNPVIPLNFKDDETKNKFNDLRYLYRVKMMNNPYDPDLQVIEKKVKDMLKDNKEYIIGRQLEALFYGGDKSGSVNYYTHIRTPEANEFIKKYNISSFNDVIPEETWAELIRRINIALSNKSTKKRILNTTTQKINEMSREGKFLVIRGGRKWDELPLEEQQKYIQEWIKNNSKTLDDFIPQIHYKRSKPWSEISDKEKRKYIEQWLKKNTKTEADFNPEKHYKGEIIDRFVGDFFIDDPIEVMKARYNRSIYTIRNGMFRDGLIKFFSEHPEMYSKTPLKGYRDISNILTFLYEDTPDGLKTITLGKDKIYVAPDIADAIEHLNNFMKPSVLKNVFDVYDKVLALVKGSMTVGKVSIGYHIRNIFGNILNSKLSGVSNTSLITGYLKSIDLYRYIKKIINGKKVDINAKKIDIIDKFSGRVYSDNDIIDYAMKYNIIGTGYMSDVKRDLSKKIKTKSGKEFINNVIDKITQTSYIAIGGELQSSIEDISKLALFIGKLIDGFNPQDAAMEVKKYLFDYTDLTEAEQTVLKRIVLFYGWVKNNLALQIKKVFSKTTETMLTLVDRINNAGGIGSMVSLSKDDKEWDKATIINKKYLDKWYKSEPLFIIDKDFKLNRETAIRLQNYLPQYDLTTIFRLFDKENRHKLAELLVQPIQESIESFIGSGDTVDSAINKTETFLGLRMSPFWKNFLKALPYGLNEYNMYNFFNIFGSEENPSIFGYTRDYPEPTTKEKVIRGVIGAPVVIHPMAQKIRKLKEFKKIANEEIADINKKLQLLIHNYSGKEFPAKDYNLLVNRVNNLTKDYEEALKSGLIMQDYESKVILSRLNNLKENLAKYRLVLEKNTVR